MPLKVGDRVRLKKYLVAGRFRGVAKITGFYDDVPGGVVLDRRLEGFRSWNVEHLVRAQKIVKIPARRRREDRVLPKIPKRRKAA